MPFTESWYLKCDENGCEYQRWDIGDEDDARTWAEANGWYFGAWGLNEYKRPDIQCPKHNTDKEVALDHMGDRIEKS